MKSVAPALSSAIRSNHVLYAKPRLIADWNMNRYGAPVASNTPDEETSGFDVEMFPIESIIEPIRPTKGICKARVGQAVVGDEYGFTNQSASARYYISDPEDVYKYWNGPNLSDGTGAITGVAPQVIYATNVDVNKIVVKLENSWATPSAFTVQVTTDGTTWSTVATNPAVRNDGQVILYYNGTAWSSTRPSSLASLKTIRGIKLNVTALTGGRDLNGNPTTYDVRNLEGTGYTRYTTDGKNSNFNLISLESHREVDLSDSLIEVTDTFDTSEVSQLYPIGTLTSNTASLSLSNVDGLFNNNNAASPFKDLLEPNVEFNLEYLYDLNNDGTFEQSVQQFKMYSESWSGQTDDTVRVDLFDASKYLQESTPRPAMWEGLTVPQIVWRVLDSVGFVDYQIDSDDRVVDHVIPVFWCDGIESVWEVLDKLAKSSQAAIYFDANGILQVKTRDIAFDNAKASDWTLRANDSGAELADIITWEQTEQFEANHITVNFQSTSWSDYNNGQPSLQAVWQPEDTITLRACPLTASLAQGDTSTMWIPADDVTYWPYEGKVNIEGEIIAFNGKQFVYYTGATGATRNTKIINSQDEYKKFNEMAPVDYRYKNHFTGALKITERGVWNSEDKAHSVEANGYSVRHLRDGNRKLDASGFRFDRHESKVTLKPPLKAFDGNDLLIATRGNDADSGFYLYGTMLRFVKEADLNHQRAGLVMHNSTANEDGYYVELVPSRTLDGKERAERNEIIVYSRVNGVNHRIGGKGVPLFIAENTWYDLDVYLDVSGGDHVINVWINGRNVNGGFVVSGANKNAKNGKFGMFVRGDTKAEYEFLYAIARPETQPIDDVSFFDMTQGGYRGGQWDREWVYRWRTQTRRKKKKSVKERSRWNQQFMDEFGPIVHEIREFDVTFDPAPVLHSRLYLQNNWTAVCTEYLANPFGAKFILANTGRTNAVVNGDYKLSYGGLQVDRNLVLAALGRGLVINEAEKVVVKNDAAIQRRGKIESDLSEKWIQTKAMANDLAEWIKNHWGTGADGAAVMIFGNPLIEIGDVVTVEYPHKSLNGVKYFVTGTSTTFNSGMETRLVLRRVV